MTFEARDTMQQLLAEHLDVFAWNHGDMPGLAPEIIHNGLSVDLKDKGV